MKVELIGCTSKEFIEGQVNICAAAGKLSRMPGTVFDALDEMKDFDKAVKFIRRVINMGHTSTIDHDYMIFALNGVTPVVEQTLIAERFSSFTVKSRREVDFSNVGFYTPEFRDKEGNVLPNNKKLQEKYNEHMKWLFASYSKIEESGIKKEDARFVLPYCYHSDFIMGVDATALARMITMLTKGKNSNISELNELGNRLKEIALERAPYIDAILKRGEDTKISILETLLDDYVKPRDYEKVASPKLLSYTKDIDKTIITNAISRIYSKTYEEAEKIYEDKISKDEKLQRKLMKAAFLEPEHEDLKQINLRFNFSLSFAVLTHFTRHRRHILSIPGFAPNVDITKYITPPSIKDSDLKDFFDEIFVKNKEVYDEFVKEGVCEEDLIYFTLSGNVVNIILNFDGEAFRWFTRLRECTKAQWEIRGYANKMHEEVGKVCKFYAENLGPDCVTKHICGEGKESCGRINSILASLKGEDEK